MRKLVLYSALFILSLLVTECHRAKINFSVKGSFKVPVETKAVLARLGVTKVEPLDSCDVDIKGKFGLHGYTYQPALYVLTADKSSIYLIIKPKDKLEVEIDNSINPPSYFVKGSADSRLVRDLVFEQGKVLSGIDDISRAYEKSKDNPKTFLANKHKFDSLYDNLLSKHRIYSKKFIHDNPNSLACIFALYQNFGVKNQPLFDKFNDIDIFNFVDSNLSALYPKTPAVIALNRDVTDIKEQIKQKKYSENLFQPDRKAPEFNLTTIDSAQFDLKLEKGKPVVMLFFASWNKKASDEAVKVNSIYQKYEAKGLRIIGISFDKSKQKLMGFIDTNNISFPVACDYKYWESGYVGQFGIRKIPEIILLDKNHIVTQRNMKSSELTSTLEDWKKNRLF